MPRVGLVCGLTVGLGASPTAAQDLQAIDLVGTWVLDEAASDDLREKLAEAEAGSPLGGGPRWNPRGGAAPRGGFRGRGARGVPPVSALGDEETDRLLRAVQVVRFELEGRVLSLRDGSQATRLLHLDGRKVDDGSGGGVYATLEDDTLLLEGIGVDRILTEELRLEGDRLVWETTLQERGEAIEIDYRMVYERVTPRLRREEPVPSATEGRDAASRPERSSARTVSSPVTRAREAPSTQQDTSRRTASRRGTILQILPPQLRPTQVLTGKVRIQTLTASQDIATVEFYLDGERVERRNHPPYETTVRLADPAREQVVEARALSASGSSLGGDRVTLNRLDPPFRVRVLSLERDGERGRLRAEISVPRESELSYVELYVSDRFVRRDDGLTLDPVRHRALLESDVDLTGTTPADFVRVVAFLDRGDSFEDVELLDQETFSEEVDVQLVQLQVLVTDKRGRPVTEVDASDFEIRDGGKVRQVEQFLPADDRSLVLGLAVDSSGSMFRIWRQTNRSIQAFLDTALRRQDRSFLVDFDTSLRLLVPLTEDRERLDRGLERLQPGGGTSLYDSILFSLLQYEGEPGRRALIVLTDGFDSTSLADPERAVEFGRRLGVPVYVIALSSSGGRGPGAAMTAGSLRNQLRLITQPTGGRLFQIQAIEQIDRVFEQIQAELRSQYLLTYSTEGDVDVIDPRIRMKTKGLEVRYSLAADQID